MTPEVVQRTYVTLVLLQTLAASLIWGVNTLFLLDAGLTLTEAFVANAAFTAGMVIFEVPTGVIADAFGRRLSFILGSGHPAGDDSGLSGALVRRGGNLVVDPGIGPDRTRFHLLLRGHRGLARRCPPRHRLRRLHRNRFRKGPGCRWCGHPGGHDRRWVPWSDQSGHPLPGEVFPALGGNPGGLVVDARSRL